MAEWIDTAQGIINNLPVMIFLQYDGFLLKFPVNPNSLKINNPSESNSVQIESLGEISVPNNNKLATLEINSFFWQDRNLVPSFFYVDWLKTWQKSKKPAKLIVTKLNYNMYVTCESFEYETRAGEENDIYYRLQLKQYKKYGAKKLKETVDVGLFDKLLNMRNGKFSPILIEIPRPERMINKPPVKNPYIVKKGDTLASITKKLNGSTHNWRDLYDKNKKVIGDSFSESGQLKEGLKLKLPLKWNLNLIQEGKLRTN